MRPSQPIKLAALACAGLLAIACGNKKQAEEARASVYDTDFTVVWNQTMAVVRDLYPQDQYEDDAGKGSIKTAWHEVHYTRTDAENDPKSMAAQQRMQDPTVANTGGRGGVAFKKYFIRFDINIVGGRPWRIRVKGRAQEWERGNAVASELRGAATPHWLPGRTDALVVEIHKRLTKYAMRAPEIEVDTEDKPKPIDTAAFGPIPDGAAKLVGEVQQAISTRDYEAIRARLAGDVTWSLGAAPGADGAMAMWQADPAILDAMSTAIREGCRGDENGVSCPPAATETPGYVGWRLACAKRGDAWRITSFVQGD
jgi:hypothetical protein